METVVREIIDTIEDYFAAAQFHFIEGNEAAPGEYVFADYPYRFSKFESWNERWMGALEPYTLQLQENGDPDGELAYFTQRFGHYVGVLIGAKFMGAPRPMLENMARSPREDGPCAVSCPKRGKKTRRA